MADRRPAGGLLPRRRGGRRAGASPAGHETTTTRAREDQRRQADLDRLRLPAAGAGRRSRGRPHHLVDPAAEHGPAGEHNYTAGWDNYCRLARGAATATTTPASTRRSSTRRARRTTGPFFENSPGANQDIGEGSLPLATGNQLAILAHRPGNVVEVPGGTSEDVNFLWTSDDGGKKFTGPGLTSTMDYYGGAVAYGSPSSIGIFGTTGELLGTRRPSGTCSSRRCGRGRSRRRARGSTSGAGKNDLLARRQIVADGDRPLVAFDDLKDVFVREYKGKGDIDDAANWTTSKFPGVDPSLASGPHGTWLTYYPPGGLLKGVVVKLVDGHRSGPTTPVFPSLLEGDEDQLAEAADGELVAGWVEKDAEDEISPPDAEHLERRPPLVEAAAALPGGPPRQVSGLQIGVGPDGGGVAVFVHGGTGRKGQRRHPVRDRRAGDRGAVRRRAARPGRRASAPPAPATRAASTSASAPSTPTSTPAASCGSRPRRTRAATPRSPTAASTSTASRSAPTRPAPRS